MSTPDTLRNARQRGSFTNMKKQIANEEEDGRWFGSLVNLYLKHCLLHAFMDHKRVFCFCCSTGRDNGFVSVQLLLALPGNLGPAIIALDQ
jgi:hypothetical protein